MDTTIPLPIIPYVPLSRAPSSQEGLNRYQLAYLGCAYFSITDEELDTLLGFLQRHIYVQTYVNAAKVTSIESIVSLLDAGARTVFVASSQFKSLEAYGDRIALVQDDSEPMHPAAGGILVAGGNDISACKSALKARAEAKTSPVFLFAASEDNLQDYVDLAREYQAVIIISSNRLTVENTSSNGQLSVPAIIAACWTSDRPDKLIPTVVTDQRGIALGLVYSNQESLSESLKTGTGVYQSRKRGLWHKGATSGDTQELVRVSLDCDQDCLKFVVKQHGRGFCHLPQSTCFGEYSGIAKLEKTLQSRKVSAPKESYTARLFSDEKLLRAKIMEEAEELCDAKTKDEIAFEAADLLYFTLTKAIGAGVTLADIERSLDAKSLKVKRRQGNAKGQWAARNGITNGSVTNGAAGKEAVVKEAESIPKSKDDKSGFQNGRISMRRYNAAALSTNELKGILQRPSQKSPETIMGIVNPIIKDVQTRGDAALLEYTHKFEKATSLKSAVLKAPFPQSLMNLPPETIEAIDISFENIRKFHSAQKDDETLRVETMPGVICSRFARPIERVGLYIPGGTAVLPSTALMLGVPAMVAGCKKIVMASPPRADGSLTPEIVYVAHKVGAESIVLAGGAQAVAAMAYGTESVSKVDKILGPGNQFVTAAKMYVSNDTNAGVGIDMPAGPSEVLVVADKHANPAFVASDLLSQAEHGTDSQVILIAIDLSETDLQAIEDELHAQAMALPRLDIVRGAIAHSVTLIVRDVKEALALSNEYAPEHLILQIKDAASAVDLVENAGSVFIGEWTPESVGDYSAGVNHSLPTYGYAKQYSGVNLASYLKHITSSHLTAQGLKNVGAAVMQLAKVEELEAHRRAVGIRIKYMEENKL
ncbi:MAG: trifunctional histidinol dehydrogenase [Claussenomyces sp. TS43310]|nr:MAG: trifunctional histidinol dehydrogenase [Claussenomyces sp. TS43310]